MHIYAIRWEIIELFSLIYYPSYSTVRQAVGALEGAESY